MAAFISTLINPIASIIDRIIPDRAAAAAAKAQLAQLEASGELQGILAQVDVNKTEAANASIFVAGWRPFIGWVCGTGLAFQFLVAPLGTWIAALFGKPVAFPSLDLGTLMTLLLGMLGLGGMRTFEKVNGVNSGH